MDRDEPTEDNRSVAAGACMRERQWLAEEIADAHVVRVEVHRSLPDGSVRDSIEHGEHAMPMDACTVARRRVQVADVFQMRGFRISHLSGAVSGRRESP